MVDRSKSSHLKQRKDVEKCLRCSFEWPRKPVGDVHHDVECRLETIVCRVYRLDVGTVRVDKFSRKNTEQEFSRTR